MAAADMLSESFVSEADTDSEDEEDGAVCSRKNDVPTEYDVADLLRKIAGFRRGTRTVSSRKRSRNPLSLPADCCLFCGEKSEKESGDKYLGRMIRLDPKLDPDAVFCVHELCLQLSPKIEEHSDGGVVMKRYSLEDVYNEIRRGAKLSCNFCHKRGATLGCCVETCKVRFHLPCGRRNGTFHLFDRAFPSYCVKHKPQIAVDKRENVANRHSVRNGVQGEPLLKTSCIMCMSDVRTKVEAGVVVATTCCTDANSNIDTDASSLIKYYHFGCTQDMAISAGRRHLKCPFSATDDTMVDEHAKRFRQQLRRAGIFIPESDPSWEADGDYPVGNAAHDLPKQCVLKNRCKCPQGYRFEEFGTAKQNLPYELTNACNDCGSCFIHRDCAGPPWNNYHPIDPEIDDDETPWVCHDCRGLAPIAADDGAADDAESGEAAPKKTGCAQIVLRDFFNDEILLK